MSDRGQTVIDYSFGVGIFLTVILFVFITIPSLFAPFESQQQDFQTAERVGTALSTNWMLQEEEPEPYVLDERCAAYLFENSPGGGGNPPKQCQFGDTNDDVTFRDIVPVEDTATGNVKRVEITLERPNSDGEYDGTPATINGGTTAQYQPDGEPPRDRASVTTSYRQVFVDGEQHRLYVRVW